MEEGCSSTVVAVVIAALQEVEMEQGCSRTCSSCGNSSTSRRWKWRSGVAVLAVVVVVVIAALTGGGDG